MISDRAAKPVNFGAVLVQPWCNQGGKDGNYALCGRFVVNSIEGVDVVFPQIQYGHSVHTIFSQTPIQIKWKSGSIRDQYHPLSWTQLEPHTEAVEQFLAMLRFEHRSEVEKLSEVLK